MARPDYDISNASYTRFMTDKSNQYASFIRKAEITRRDHNDMPSKEEALYLVEAGKICAEIMGKNLSQRDVHSKWERRKMECDDEVRAIIKQIAPPPAPVPVAEPASAAKPVEVVPPAAENKQVAAKAPVKDKGKVAGTTESGFTTKNACRDVNAETIESWYKEKPKHNFSNVSGMEDLKDKLRSQMDKMEWAQINQKLDISPVQSFFFYGPAGCGKTFVIEAFASELIEKRGYKFIRLLGGDIHASLVGVAEKTVEIAFKEAIDNEPCIIFIDEVENVCVNRSDPKVEGHEKRLTVAFLEAYNLLQESGKNVIFMGATNYPSKVDNAMLDRVKMFKIPLPPEEARKSYFERAFKNVSLQDITFDEIAEMTENSSYRDLGRVKDELFWKLQNAAIDYSAVRNEDGSLDMERTDLAGAQAIDDGIIAITREMVESTVDEFPPSNKVDIQEALEEFERSISKLG